MLWQKLKEWHRKLHNRNDKDRRKMLRQKIEGWHRKLQNIKDKGRCNRLRQKLKGGSSDHDRRGDFKKRKEKYSIFRSIEAKKAAFHNPEEKEGEKSERDLSRQRGGVGNFQEPLNLRLIFKITVLGN